ncbi:MAG TPA: hypothetical protein EYP98_20495, partial [Planctomycetes bacterium]|nr:hypothetical protein [Planctomycetota bacterium]
MRNTNGSLVFEARDIDVPNHWSQVAIDILAQKYFRKAGVPQVDGEGAPVLDDAGSPVLGGESDARQVFHRLAGCWRHWGEKHGYFDSADDAQAFEDELSHMLAAQHAAPNSPQWFNTGLHFKYGITGPAQGHWFVDDQSQTVGGGGRGSKAEGNNKKTTERAAKNAAEQAINKSGPQLKKSSSAYERPQPHACFIQSIQDDLDAIALSQIDKLTLIEATLRESRRRYHQRRDQWCEAQAAPPGSGRALAAAGG